MKATIGNLSDQVAKMGEAGRRSDSVLTKIQGVPE